MSKIHSKYVTLYQYLWDFIPIKVMVTGFINNLGFKTNRLKFTSNYTVFEYNQVAHKVENCPNLTLTKKNSASKYHWFSQHVDLGDIHIEKVELKNQKVDIFTRGIPRDKFVQMIKFLCWWWFVFQLIGSVTIYKCLCLLYMV